jgi:hypothetical protein
MAQTTPPTITAAPSQPTRGDKPTFSARIDAFVAWLITAVAQFAAVATNVYNNAVDAYGSSVAASTSANTATSAAAAALATANVVPWASGTTYQQYANVVSPANGGTYRRKTAAGSGTTDPSLDTTNYAPPRCPPQ